MNNWLLLITVSLSLTLPLFAQNDILDALNANNDHGFWWENRIEKKLSKNWFFTFNANYRWGSYYRKLWYQEYIPIFHYDFTPLIHFRKPTIFTKFTFGPGYDQTYELRKNTEGVYHHIFVNKPLLEGNLFLTVQRWRLNQRMRPEYHYHCRSHYKNYLQYRHRLEVFTPWKFTKININPYLSNEWFFRKNSYSSTNHPKGHVGGYYQNRFRVCLRSELSQDLMFMDLFWQWRADRKPPNTDPCWFNTYAYGLFLKLSF